MSLGRAPLSLDLDNKWSYLKTHGDESWRELPSYLDFMIERVLGVLAAHGLTITVFVVGQDAEQSWGAEAVRALADAGHEIGNHSFLHEPWLHLFERAELRADLTRAHEAITAAAGVRPVGFRGPGFSMSAATLDELAALGYEYDATIFPNALNPLSRAYYFATSNLTKEERRQRKELFGTFKDAFRPNVPFAWSLDAAPLTEVPVTTMPGLRVPIHFSYVLWLGGKSEALARAYFEFALWLCRRRGVPPSLLLHPPDFMGAEDDEELAFFPGMSMARARKLELLDDLLEILCEHYVIEPLGSYVRSLGTTRERVPDFG
jgi:hypothetical protein